MRKRRKTVKMTHPARVKAASHQTKTGKSECMEGVRKILTVFIALDGANI